MRVLCVVVVVVVAAVAVAVGVTTSVKECWLEILR
jgi:hypothetical protein